MKYQRLAIACLSAFMAVAGLTACEKPVTFNDFLNEEITPSISLPQILSNSEVQPAIVLSIKQNTVYLGKTAVALKSNLTAPDSYGGRGLVASLYTSLYNASQQWTNLISGTAHKMRDLSLLGFNQVPAEITKANIDTYLNPPLLIASDARLTLNELIAIMATAGQAGITDFRIMVINRATGLPSQEEILPPAKERKARSFATSAPSINFAVRVKSSILEIVDSQNILVGPTGAPSMTLARRATGLFETPELETYLRSIKQQFPATTEAHIGGDKNIDLAVITELLSSLRCNRNSTGSCQNGYFPDIYIWPKDYEAYMLGPIIVPGVAN